MRCDYFTHATGGGCSRINSATHGRYVASYNRGNESGIDLLIADEMHICRFDHRVSRFDHCHETSAFHHSERFFHCFSSKPDCVTNVAKHLVRHG
jgi:hypothetical protein